MTGFHFCIPSPSGNTGDDVLAHATREFLGQLGIDTWTLCNVRDHVTPAIVDRANQHDVVVVGGGGLLLRDTNPNDVSGWQWKCPAELLPRFRKPLVVLAIGYNAFRGQAPFDRVFETHLARLIDGAALFTVRNSGSRAALERHGLSVERVRICPCPSLLIQPRCVDVLAPPPRPLIGLQLAGDRPSCRFPDATVLPAAVDRIVGGLRQRGCDVVFVAHSWSSEGNLDAIAARHPDVPRMDLSAVWGRGDIDRLCWFYRRLACVVAMRGHGQMIPFGQGTPVVSLITHDKLRWFLEDCSMTEWGVDVATPDLGGRILERVDAARDGAAWTPAQRRAMDRWRSLAAGTLNVLRGAL